MTDERTAADPGEPSPDDQTHTRDEGAVPKTGPAVSPEPAPDAGPAPDPSPERLGGGL